MTVGAPAPTRLCDLAEQAGLSRLELRGYLLREVYDGHQRAPEEISERDRQLFVGDVGFIGFGPPARSAKQSWEPSGQPQITAATSTCVNGHRYRPEDVDRLGRRRCSHCRPGGRA